jgi:hypothetical protein
MVYAESINQANEDRTKQPNQAIKPTEQPNLQAPNALSSV